MTANIRSAANPRERIELLPLPLGIPAELAARSHHKVLHFLSDEKRSGRCAVPPELRRRFTLGTFFFDLPSGDEREAIWKIYTAKYSVDGARPQDDNWTGAEIKECCRKAYRLRISLQDSASYIVPIARSAQEQVESLRSQSSGKYLSASHPGVYEYNKVAPAPRGRALRSLN